MLISSDSKLVEKRGKTLTGMLANSKESLPSSSPNILFSESPSLLFLQLAFCKMVVTFAHFKVYNGHAKIQPIAKYFLAKDSKANLTH